MVPIKSNVRGHLLESRSPNTMDMSTGLWHSFQAFPCPLAISTTSYFRSQDACGPRHNIIWFCCIVVSAGDIHGWGDAADLLCTCSGLFGIIVDSQEEWKMPVGHTTRHHAVVFFMYRCTRQLSVRESFGVRSPRQYFQVSTWLVCEIVIDNIGLRETEHPSSVSGVYPYVSALQGRGCSWV